MKFKFISTLFFALILAFSACKKDKKEGTDSTNTLPEEPKDEVITTPPTSFASKAVIEMFGGEWCDACPAGVETITNIKNANPDMVYGAVVHYNDPFETINHNVLFGHLGGVAAYPTGAVNRTPAASAGGQNDYVVFNKEYWMTNVNRFINKKTDLGIAISSTIDSVDVNITVHIHATTIDPLEDYKLTVYVIENDVSTDNQIGKPAGFMHQMLLRGSLSNATGDAIGLPKNVTLKKDYSFKKSGSFNLDNLKILAFVNTEGGTSSNRKIHNAQEVKVGYTANWD